MQEAWLTHTKCHGGRRCLEERGRYAGNIVIFKKIEELPLIGLDELRHIFAEVAEKLETGNMRTIEAE